MHMRSLGCLAILCTTVLACSGSAPAASEPPKTTTAVAPAANTTVTPAPGSEGPGTIVSSTPAPADPEGRIRWALAGQHRTEKERARDRYRHPQETLAFFGIKPEMKVVELWPGGGWYTAVLAPVLRDRGKLTVTNFAPVGPNGEQRENAQKFAAKLRGAPGIYDQVDVKIINPPSYLSLGPDGSADVVVTFRNIHNWMGDGFADKVFAAAFQVLKRGGVLGVEEHRAAPGTDAKKSADTGYVPEETVIQLAKAAGFVLDAKSEINANPKDTKDYPKGVWTLPPTLELGATDREKYLAIGESDRMTLRFKKP
ncbi:class I SAM-dependent methyltransferase [Pendulispora albinea]|uniref:Methyltransferase n=1 Tax=Pendulispora albinea TaxID=2741071 RepID=A0ABZ2M998_9BACT